MLYDISWATIAATVQMCMDDQHYEGSNHSGFARDATLLTLTPRFKLLDQIFKDSAPCPSPGELEWAYEQTQTMLCLSIKSICFGRECVCLGAHSNCVQELVNISHLALSSRVANPMAISGLNTYRGNLQKASINILRKQRP